MKVIEIKLLGALSFSFSYQKLAMSTVKSKKKRYSELKKSKTLLMPLSSPKFQVVFIASSVNENGMPFGLISLMLSWFYNSIVFKRMGKTKLFQNQKMMS